MEFTKIPHQQNAAGPLTFSAVEPSINGPIRLSVTGNADRLQLQNFEMRVV